MSIEGFKKGEKREPLSVESFAEYAQHPRLRHALNALMLVGALTAAKAEGDNQITIGETTITSSENIHLRDVNGGLDASREKSVPGDKTIGGVSGVEFEHIGAFPETSRVGAEEAVPVDDEGVGHTEQRPGSGVQPWMVPQDARPNAPSVLEALYGIKPQQ